MDGRSPLFAFAVYLTVAVVLAAVASLAILHFGFAGHAVPYDLVDPTLAEASDKTGPAVRAAELVVPTTPVATADQDAARRIELLENLVDQKNKQLRELAQQLETKTKMLAQLRAEFDDATAAAVDMMAQPAPAGAAADSGPAEGDRGRLQAELAMAEAVQKKLSADIEQLQDELKQANQELADAQLQSLTEAATAQLRARQLEQAIVALFGSIGTPAVPALIHALDNANPEVRRWAATALGRIGPDAGDAVPALTEALSDDNDEVRKAAKAALESVGR